MVIELGVFALVFLFFFIGNLLGKLAKQETRDGRRHLFMLRSIFLAIISVVSFYYAGYLSALYLIIGILLGFTLKVTDIYLGLAVAAAALFSKEYFLIIAILALSYYLVKGMQEPFRKRSLLFFLPALLLLYPLPAQSLSALAAGLLVSSM